MGYYTNYDIAVRREGKGKFTRRDMDKLIAFMRINVSEDDRDRFALPDDFSGLEIIGYAVENPRMCDNDKAIVFDNRDSVKWYDYEEQMIELSRYFPDMVFRVSGEGEDVGDEWQAFFHNGKTERCYSHHYYDKPQSIKWPAEFSDDGFAL